MLNVTFAATRGRTGWLIEVQRFSPVAVERAVRQHETDIQAEETEESRRHHVSLAIGGRYGSQILRRAQCFATLSGPSIGKIVLRR